MYRPNALIDFLRVAMLAGFTAACAVPATAAAPESFEFLAEHLAEGAVDNRYASLPVWNRADFAGRERWFGSVQVGYSRTVAGNMRLSGSLVSVAVGRELPSGWELSGFAFFDRLTFAGSGGVRPLRILFVASTPLDLPADARFGSLEGSARDIGIGFAIARPAESHLLGHYRWQLGGFWQAVTLDDFGVNFQLLSGRTAGTSGRSDYSGRYAHLTPFAGVSWQMGQRKWRFSPHVLLAVPLPRRGIQGRISGPGFDLRGDTAANGEGKHFGDAALNLGLEITFTPWNLSVDVGSAITQALIEPIVHKGVDTHLLLSARWAF